MSNTEGHYEIVFVDGHEVKVKQFKDGVWGRCVCQAMVFKPTLVAVEQEIHHIHEVAKNFLTPHQEEEDAIYIRWDTKVDSPWGEQQPYPLSFHKTLDGAIAAVPPAFKNLARPNPRYIRDFLHEAIERRVLKP